MSLSRKYLDFLLKLSKENISTWFLLRCWVFFITQYTTVISNTQGTRDFARNSLCSKLAKLAKIQKATREKIFQDLKACICTPYQYYNLNKNVFSCSWLFIFRKMFIYISFDLQTVYLNWLTIS